jgi:hypothetical protein
VVIDVRLESGFRAAHLPFARSIPVQRVGGAPAGAPKGSRDRRLLSGSLLHAVRGSGRHSRGSGLPGPQPTGWRQ